MSAVKESDKGRFTGKDKSRSRGKISFTGRAGKELNGRSKNPSTNDEDRLKSRQ